MIQNCICFPRKNNLICLFLWIRIELYFPLVSPLLIDFESAFRLFSEFFVLITFEKSEASLAKILHFNIIPSGNSFIYIKNKSGPNSVPFGTPEFICLQSEICPFSTTLCFQSLR